jgi:hypothetical protein
VDGRESSISVSDDKAVIGTSRGTLFSRVASPLPFARKVSAGAGFAASLWQSTVRVKGSLRRLAPPLTQTADRP